MSDIDSDPTLETDVDEVSAGVRDPLHPIRGSPAHAASRPRIDLTATTAELRSNP